MYIEKYEGSWNYPFLNSKTLNYKLLGYVPKFRGGCFGIIPYGENFVIFSEDDDHFFEIGTINLNDLNDLKMCLKSLSEDTSVKIDRIKCISLTKYIPNKKTVFNKNYSKGNVKLKLNDRGQLHSPLVDVKIDKLDMTFDLSFAKKRYQVIKSLLENI